jgi:hypothetical protein
MELNGACISDRRQVFQEIMETFQDFSLMRNFPFKPGIPVSCL